jgi:hypothetical protein
VELVEISDTGQGQQGLVAISTSYSGRQPKETHLSCIMFFI